MDGSAAFQWFKRALAAKPATVIAEQFYSNFVNHAESALPPCTVRLGDESSHLVAVDLSHARTCSLSWLDALASPSMEKNRSAPATLLVRIASAGAAKPAMEYPNIRVTVLDISSSRFPALLLTQLVEACSAIEEWSQYNPKGRILIASDVGTSKSYSLALAYKIWKDSPQVHQSLEELIGEIDAAIIRSEDRLVQSLHATPARLSDTIFPSQRRILTYWMDLCASTAKDILCLETKRATESPTMDDNGIEGSGRKDDNGTFNVAMDGPRAGHGIHPVMLKSLVFEGDEWVSSHGMATFEIWTSIHSVYSTDVNSTRQWINHRHSECASLTTVIPLLKSEWFECPTKFSFSLQNSPQISGDFLIRLLPKHSPNSKSWMLRAQLHAALLQLCPTLLLNDETLDGADLLENSTTIKVHLEFQRMEILKTPPAISELYRSYQFALSIRESSTRSGTD